MNLKVKYHKQLSPKQILRFVYAMKYEEYVFRGNMLRNPLSTLYEYERYLFWLQSIYAWHLLFYLCWFDGIIEIHEISILLEFHFVKIQIWKKKNLKKTIHFQVRQNLCLQINYVLDS